MGAGFESRTTGGKIQFSTDFSAYGYVGKYTLAGVVEYGLYVKYTLSLSSASSPLAFVRASSSQSEYLDGVAQGPAVVSGSDWTLTFYTKNYVGSRREITVFVFDKMTLGGRLGLQVFDESGAVAFNSNQPPMLIAACIQVPEASAGGQNFKYSSLSSSRMYAVSSAGLRSGLDIQESPAGELHPKSWTPSQRVGV
ncbi:MAG: hypothetical protein GAK36_00237 [Pseudomonas sp.]|nr:MAG: hypothetical protein GAK36_00237 [Pseudomonas sp.]